MEKEEKLSWVAHRIMLEQEIAARRDKEWDLVLARDHELLKMIREDYWEETLKECKLREVCVIGLLITMVFLQRLSIIHVSKHEYDSMVFVLAFTYYIAHVTISRF